MCSSRLDTLPSGTRGRSVRLLEPSTTMRASCSFATRRMAAAIWPTWVSRISPSALIAAVHPHAAEAGVREFVHVQDDDMISAITAELARHVRGGKDMPKGIG